MLTNLEIYNNMTITPASKVKSKVKELIQYKERYEAILKGQKTNMKWFHIAILHYRECNNNFNCWLANGEKIIKNKPTILVPKNLITKIGSFEDTALISLNKDNMFNKNWDNISDTLNNFEGYNGLGYRRKNLISPYLFSFTNQYQTGKFIKDGVYSKDAKDAQIGCAPLLYYFLNPERL